MEEDGEAFDGLKQVVNELYEREIISCRECVEPTDEELDDIELMAQKLWKLDYNR